MKLRRGWLLGLTALLLFGAAPARAAGWSQKTFETFVKEAAKRRGFTLCRAGVAQYDAKQAPLYFATLTKTVGARTTEAIVFAYGKTSRAFTTSEPELGEPACTGSKGAPVWEKGKEVTLGPWGADPKEHYHLSVVDGELVLLSESADDKFISVRTDWEALEYGGRSTDEERESAHAMLPLLGPRSPWAARLPKPRTWVTFGEAAHGGPADAGLDVRVALAGKALRVEMAATDDVARPLGAADAADAVFLRADHFELWFCAPTGGTRCDKKSARQLGVARLADGQLHARWLHPKGHKEKLPAVEAAPNGVAVTIPLAQMAVDGKAQATDEKLEGKLTVAYSDSDTEGKGQETLVATSLLRWADPASFGLFVRQPRGARFPPWTGSAEVDEDEEFLREDEGEQ
jgi:hypothetical protein